VGFRDSRSSTRPWISDLLADVISNIPLSPPSSARYSSALTSLAASYPGCCSGGTAAAATNDTPFNCLMNRCEAGRAQCESGVPLVVARWQFWHGGVGSRTRAAMARRSWLQSVLAVAGRPQLHALPRARPCSCLYLARASEGAIIRGVGVGRPLAAKLCPHQRG
jgi:hypothetical protein